MTTYIAIDDILNITNKEESDVFSFMAGGIFDYTYAGSSGYNAGFTPAPNLTAFFINQAMDMALSMLDLNENFVEFALLPMQILIYKEYERNFEREIRQTVTQAVDTMQKAFRISEGEHGFERESNKESTSKGGKSSIEFLQDMLNERRKNEAKRTLQQIGFQLGGPLGAIAAGWAYDGEIKGSTVVDVVTGTLTHQLTNFAVQSLSKALGITSTFGTIGLTWGIGELLGELGEIMMGLDNHFGFGGQLNAIAGNTTFYDRPMSFMEWLKDTFGMLDSPIGQVDQKGEKVTGVRYKGEIYGYTRSLTFQDALHNRAPNLTLENIDPDKQKAKGWFKEQFEIKQRADPFGAMSNFGINQFGEIDIDTSPQKQLERIGLPDLYGSLMQENLQKEIEKSVQTFKGYMSGAGANTQKGRRTKASLMTGLGKLSRSAKSLMRQGAKAGGAAADAAAGKNLGWSMRDKTKDRKGGLYGGGSIGSRTGGAHSRGGAAAGAAAGGAASAGRNAAGKK